jgi:hypothetical protein
LQFEIGRGLSGLEFIAGQRDRVPFEFDCSASSGRHGRFSRVKKVVGFVIDSLPSSIAFWLADARDGRDALR